jgi:hypothetical protein
LFVSLRYWIESEAGRPDSVSLIAFYGCKEHKIGIDSEDKGADHGQIFVS